MALGSRQQAAELRRQADRSVEGGGALLLCDGWWTGIFVCLCHFSSFIPALPQNPERGFKTTWLSWLMNGGRLRFSVVTN